MLLSVIAFSSCVKDKEIPKGFIEVGNTKWDIKGKFLGQNITVPLTFNSDGTAIFGTVSASWLQTGNEVVWFTKDNVRFEGRLGSAAQMKGEYFNGESVLSSGTFTGTRK